MGFNMAGYILLLLLLLNEYIFYNEKKAIKWLLKSFHYILNEDGDEDNIEFFFKNKKDFSFGGIKYDCRVDVKFLINNKYGNNRQHNDCNY